MVIEMVKVPQKRISAEFFQSERGIEPVREILKELGRPVKTQVGEDIRFVELNWRVDKPYVDKLRSGKGEFEKTLYEVRHTVEKLEYRTLFFVYGSAMVLTHFFQKNTRKTPSKELDLGWARMKEWVRAQKSLETKVRKKGK